MVKMGLFSKFQRSPLDIWLIATTIFLVIFGLLTIYDATVIVAFRDFGDKLYYFKNQLTWVSLGFMSLFFFAFFDYHKLLKMSPIVLMFSILLLIMVLVPHIGTEVYGSRRWISLGNFTFQPSEITKLVLIFYEVAIISRFEKYKISLQDAAIVLFLPAVLATGLVLAERDLGTALIFIAITLTTYFVGGGPIWHFALVIPLLVVATIGAISIELYRLARLKCFLNPAFDVQGACYQINQILIALSAGGLLGVGLGGSRAKFAFIPEVQSDAIFAIVVEELGFLGASFLILAFIFLISRAIKIAKEASDFPGKVLAAAIAGLFSIQTFFNLASVVALIPLTGISLPFISYGGSSLFVMMAAIGILLNIARQRREVLLSTRAEK